MTGPVLLPNATPNMTGAVIDARRAPTLRPAIIPDMPVKWARLACTCFPSLVAMAVRRLPGMLGCQHLIRTDVHLHCHVQATCVGVSARHWDRLVRMAERAKSHAGRPAIGARAALLCFGQIGSWMLE